MVDGHATVGRLSNNVFWTFQAIWENFEKSRWTVTRPVVEVTRPSADCQTTFFGRFKQLENFLKKVAQRSRNSVWGHATVGRLSNNVFWTFQAIRNFFEKSRWTVTRQWLRSRDRRPTVKRRFLDISSDLGKFWKKSLNGHATVVEGHATVDWLSNNAFGRFKQFGKILKKVAERSGDSGRRSRDRRPTVKQRFLDVSSDLEKFWKKSLNGHATVVEVTRPSADCQTTFFGRFKQLEIFLKKVAERSRDSGRWSRDRRPTVKQRFLDVSSDLGKFGKKSLNGYATVVEVTRPSADCQTTFFGRFKQLEIFLKKSLNGHATVVEGHATVDWLSNNVFGRFKQFGKILKKVAERSGDSGRRSRDRRPTVKQRFLDVSSDWENFEKSRWTVTRQWSEVTRPSADCQTTFFGRFKQLEIFLKKVAERSRDSDRRSRDRRPTVKQRFLDVSSDLEKFWKKSLNGHATVVEVTRPSADCQTTFFGRFKQLEIFLKKVAERSRDSGRWSRDRRPTVKQRFLDVSSDLGKFWKKSLNGHATVVEVTRPSADCQTTFFRRFKQLEIFLKKVAERSRDSGRWSRDRRPTVKQRLLDVSSD